MAGRKIMDELRKLMRWEFIVSAAAVASAVVSWYFATNYKNQIQDDSIKQIYSLEQTHDNRISALEQKQNSNDTQMAVIRVQLDAIQADLKDIKSELKKK